MSQRLTCRSNGSVRLPDPAAYLAAFCATARSYAEVDSGEGWARIDLGYAAVELRQRLEEVSLSIRATDNGTIAALQAMMTEHLRDNQQNRDLGFLWREAPPRLTRAYREMTVVAVTDITPHMRSFTLNGENLQPFVAGGLHVHLYFPGAAPLVQPTIDDTGRVTWPGEAPEARAYTIRHIDAAAGLVEIDMLLHPSHGPAPGGDFARDGRPGAIIGMSGPGGGQLPPSRWVLLAGDETALPAIARMLETLPAETRAVVRIEVVGEADRLPLRSAADVDLHWLYRGAVPAAQSRLLLDALMQADFPDRDTDCFVWFAAEADIAREAKAWLRGRDDLSPSDFIAAGFWRA